MIKVIKGILYRMINNKAYLSMPLIITPIVIAAAIYFSSSVVTRPNIGVVGIEDFNFNNNEINIIKLDKKAPLSDLVKNEYDAIISIENGNFKVDTIKSDDYKSKIEGILRGEKVDFQGENKRGVGANIIGFLTMFLIMLGVMLYKFFFDEKKGMAKRIISSNISYEQYVLSHFAAVFIMIFIPTVIITVMSKSLFNIRTSLNNVELSFIVLILSLLASSFGLLMSSIVKSEESASMLGSMITIITTLISGSFFTISNNSFITSIGEILPQKHILDFAIALENDNTINYGDVSNVILVTIFMIILSFVINKYKMRKYNCI